MAKDNTTEKIPNELVNDEVVLTIENLHRKVFILWYRNRFRPASANIVANDIKDAQKRGEAYCNKFHLRFISVIHFFADMNIAPPESTVKRYQDDDVDKV